MRKIKNLCLLCQKEKGKISRNYSKVPILWLDLVKKMLTYDPDDRISVKEALEHPYLKALHFPDDEPTTQPVSAYDFDFEKYSLSKEDFKDLIYDEILLYHSDEAAL